MASTLSTLGKNRVLNALDSYAFASAHSGDPGATGTSNELTGGTPAYARVALTWAAAGSGSKAIAATVPTFNVPAGQTVAFIGMWTLASGGEYGGCWDVTDEAFVGQGTYTLSAATVSVS